MITEKELIFLVIGYFLCYFTGILISVYNMILDFAYISRKRRKEYDKK